MPDSSSGPTAPSPLETAEVSAPNALPMSPTTSGLKLEASESRMVGMATPSGGKATTTSSQVALALCHPVSLHCKCDAIAQIGGGRDSTLVALAPLSEAARW